LKLSGRVLEEGRRNEKLLCPKNNMWLEDF
jgi:hypothetical protein